MGFINVKKKEVQIKIVYYGPGRGGKTTNLDYINKKYKQRIKTEMVSIKTHGDRTLFFDFLPVDIGKIHGFDIKIQLYTVPGQVKYNATRKLVLKGVDGIVFVADLQKERRDSNLKSLEQMKENLLTHNKDVFKIPLVLQYNKIDLKGQGIPLLTVEEMEQDLNQELKVPFFVGSALAGDNVVETLKKIISMTLISFRKELQ
ncbi:MAG: GTPase domain-containing protein [Proteobacteria bacterium]|nr:GTPase domain-containing protein [Pseudomonadota bacterium]MBU4297649.1 GTPase domain-containing protein [Pseudomonadota bacterium]MCG2749989.1 GTPase domain-containing protein [Desulfobulbaceae bacterium]